LENIYRVDDILIRVRPEKPRNCGLIPSNGKQFLDAFTKLGKATINFVMSVRPSVRLYGTTRQQLDECL